jgi:hypothetical protein
MAGHRRGTGKPTRAAARAARMRARLEAELAEALTPAAKVGAAADFLRSALTRNPDSQVADEVVADLIAAADRIKEGART